MEIKKLNSILFKELMPWTFDTKGTKAINEKIKKVGSKEPTMEPNWCNSFRYYWLITPTSLNGLQSKIQRVKAL